MSIKITHIRLVSKAACLISIFVCDYPNNIFKEQVLSYDCNGKLVKLLLRIYLWSSYGGMNIIYSFLLV
jgi:hypothetical protein